MAMSTADGAQAREKLDEVCEVVGKVAPQQVPVAPKEHTIILDGICVIYKLDRKDETKILEASSGKIQLHQASEEPEEVKLVFIRNMEEGLSLTVALQDIQELHHDTDQGRGLVVKFQVRGSEEVIYRIRFGCEEDAMGLVDEVLACADDVAPVPPEVEADEDAPAPEETEDGPAPEKAEVHPPEPVDKKKKGVAGKRLRKICVIS